MFIIYYILKLMAPEKYLSPLYGFDFKFYFLEIYSLESKSVLNFGISWFIRIPIDFHFIA